MKFQNIYSLKEIAGIINSTYIGHDNFPVYGMNEIHVAESGDIVFVDHPKYYKKALQSMATIILINKNVECPKGKALLISDDPFRDFNILTKYFKPFQPFGSTSINTISATAQIGEGTIIQPNSFIGHHTKIGQNCLIHANVTIYDNVEIGNNVVIHSGTILAADAFYFKKRPEGFDQLLSSGRLIIKNNVSIGALCTIDKGVTGDTVIGEGTKIDNQVHIAHDTTIGKNCLIAAQTGISGCVTIEDEVTIWGQVGISSGIKIGSKAILMARSAANKSLEGGKSYFGSPAEDSRTKMKELIYIKRIPEILKKLK
ncbi:UDP-3-O-(3-hydroxymyristoyl)glucosamine N-acyltransferase [Flavobacterium poyangense]|uniref:UDP-3-O-(3-hydroxymyristoyl)glucosamine N-acyltransferase n=1 Tax=Flavobacterium poyangense TaxID=2204302 RepID=UPI001421401B|nr:UDP-3-O-(3-hydroxymyristoyl)glucosamine N-acyltransferase [Flavobacterium sp. JXAS1]